MSFDTESQVVTDSLNNADPELHSHDAMTSDLLDDSGSEQFSVEGDEETSADDCSEDSLCDSEIMNEVSDDMDNEELSAEDVEVEEQETVGGNAAQADDGEMRFGSLGLSPALMQAITSSGYTTPTPIQAATIPVLLGGHDLIGQAQTGTGKTAAFALPFLSMLEVARREPQLLVLVPTRELAIQVAEAFQKYATHLPGLHVLPIYGGQSYTPQLNALRRGTHVIVGTPGRVMDHLERGTLSLDTLRFVVLDEADEMLQMGFVDAIDQILGRAPAERQVALFSATLPTPIRRIAQKHLRQPREITIRAKTTTATNIRQRYWLVSGLHKLDALTRILRPGDCSDSLAAAALTRSLRFSAPLGAQLGLPSGLRLVQMNRWASNMAGL